MGKGYLNGYIYAQVYFLCVFCWGGGGGRCCLPAFRGPRTLREHSRCWSAVTHGLHSGHRTWCGSRSRDGHTRRQTWFYDRFRKSEHRLCALPGNAVLLPLFFSLALYSFQIVDAISWAKEKMVAN